MSANKSSLSGAASYQELGAYWDEHDLGEAWEHTEAAEFSVAITAERKYFAIDLEISKEISKIAKLRGISPNTLVNLWIQEKVAHLNRT